MSVDTMQEKIRKLKNPSVVDFTVTEQQIPPHLLETEGSFCKAYGKFCRELLEGLKNLVPVVRFRFSSFALLGPEGLTLLQELLLEAKKQGYYVLLDGVEAWTMQAAQFAADMLFTEQWLFDGLIVSSYIGSDGLKPYMALLKEQKKMLFAVLRTANKTAPELQDLLTGTRLVHMAAADVVNRLGEQLPSRCGYWQIGSVGAANAADSLRSLRAKYRSMFLLVDGMDYSNANAKNCSYAFDKLGHGAAICAGTSVTAAWLAEETDGQNYVELAVQAAERLKKNLLRYITIL